MKSKDCPIIVLVGPTAVGKTACALELVQRFDCEIVSMDSMQVYRYMDIGTAKPSVEEQAQVPHHLIDIVDPDEQYDVARFVYDAEQAIEEIAARGKAALLTGGTGLYLKAFFEGLFSALPTDPEVREKLQQRLAEEGREVLYAELARIDSLAAARIHQNDTQRLLRGLEIFQISGETWTDLLKRQQQEKSSQIRFNRVFQVGLTCDREELYQRIAQRSGLMLEQGLLAEVESLCNMGYSLDLPSMQSIGYRHVGNFLSGLWNQSEMLEYLIRDTRRYAKRQMTWFKKNKSLQWVDRQNYALLIEQINKALSL